MNMKCVRCDQEIDGELIRCSTNCLCGGKEGRIVKDGITIARVAFNDDVCHIVPETCIEALKHRIMALEAHT
jgi:hypothetical protein